MAWVLASNFCDLLREFKQVSVTHYFYTVMSYSYERQMIRYLTTILLKPTTVHIEYGMFSLLWKNHARMTLHLLARCVRFCARNRVIAYAHTAMLSGCHACHDKESHKKNFDNWNSCTVVTFCLMDSMNIMQAILTLSAWSISQLKFCDIYL